MNEIWKPIPGYKDIYEVSNLGRIKSYARRYCRILRASLNTKGYPQVCLWRDGGKSIFRVHRLVLLTFLGENNLECNHKDGIKTNNRLDNLEYCTPQENIKHKVINGLVARGNKIPNNKLNIQQVKAIKLRLSFGETYWNIAKDYLVVPGTIYAIKNGRTFSYVDC